MTIHQELKQIRRDLGLSVRTVSAGTGIPRSTISDAENATHKSRYNTIMALKEYYSHKLEEKQK